MTKANQILAARNFDALIDTLNSFEDGAHWNVAGPKGRYSIMSRGQVLTTVSSFDDVRAYIANAYRYED